MVLLKKHPILGMVFILIYSCSDGEKNTIEANNPCPVELSAKASSFLEKAQIDPCLKTLQHTFKKGAQLITKYSCVLKNTIKLILDNKDSIKTLVPDFPRIPDIDKSCLESLDEPSFDVESSIHNITGKTENLKKLKNLDDIKKNIKDLAPMLSTLSFDGKNKKCSLDDLKKLNELAQNSATKFVHIIEKIKNSTLGKTLDDQSAILEFTGEVLADKQKCERFKLGLELVNKLNDTLACVGKDTAFAKMTPPSLCPSSSFEFGISNIGSLQKNMEMIDSIKTEFESFQKGKYFGINPSL